MRETPEVIAEAIMNLNVRDLVRLRKLLDDKGMGDWFGGVREPRRPEPPLDATGVALDAETGKVDETGWPEPKPLPEDYWETAQ